jgi:hypothetical protein
MHVQTITIDPLSLKISEEEYTLGRRSLCTKYLVQIFIAFFRHFLYVYSVRIKIRRIKLNEEDIKLSGLYIVLRSTP